AWRIPSPSCERAAAAGGIPTGGRPRGSFGPGPETRRAAGRPPSAHEPGVSLRLRRLALDRRRLVADPDLDPPRLAPLRLADADLEDTVRGRGADVVLGDALGSPSVRVKLPKRRS